MRIKFAEVLNISIPFKKSFEHSLAVHNQVNSVILIVETERGVIGYGECIPRKYVTGETTGSVMKQLNEIILPQLLGKEFLSMGQLKDWLLEFNQHFGLGERDLCVQCVVDLALVDAFCKETGKNVADYLGPLQKRLIYYSAVVSAGNTQKVFKTLLKYKAMMINQVKLKVGTDHGQDLFNLMMVRKILGVNAEIRVDANAMWDLNETLIKLKDFARYGVISIEQPMPVQLKDQYPILVEQLKGKVHVCVDESLCSIAEAKWFGENKGASVFNLRISKNGGLINSLEIYRLAKKYGINCQLGAQVGETSILSGAGRLMACLTGDLIFHEGSFGTYLLKKDVVEKSLRFGMRGIGGMKGILGHPGLGIAVNETMLFALSQ